MSGRYVPTAASFKWHQKYPGTKGSTAQSKTTNHASHPVWYPVGVRNRCSSIQQYYALGGLYFGFLRSGEATISSGTKFDAGAHLTVEDLSVDVPANPTSIHVVIKASKTDPFRKGIAIVIRRTDNPIYPVTAMMAYLAVRGMNQGPLFRCQDGSPLTRDSFVQRVKQTLKKAGFDSSQYVGHSFRIGAATKAAACGIQDSLIKTLGRWESSAYLAYVKIPRETLAGVSHRLAIWDR